MISFINHQPKSLHAIAKLGQTQRNASASDTQPEQNFEATFPAAA